MKTNPDLIEKAGYGIATGHHGELLQGAFSDAGKIVRALVTMPYPPRRACAHFVARPEPAIVVNPADKQKAARAAELTMTYLSWNGGGELSIASDIPPGLGLGSSTADVVATIRAVAVALGQPLSDEAVGRLAVAAERASDSIMFQTPVLFAHREGRIVERFDAGLPMLRILSIVCGSEVNTLAHPPARYSLAELGRFDELRDQLRVALRHRDPVALAAVSTESVRINQSHLPFPAYERLEEIGDETGALGIQASHSGAIAGVIFDASDPVIDDRLEAARSAFEESGAVVLDTFAPTTDPHREETP
jgi:uncharacterized protein involved in propanediol utilization